MHAWMDDEWVDTFNPWMEVLFWASNQTWTRHVTTCMQAQTIKKCMDNRWICMKGIPTFHHGLYSPQRHGPESTWTEWNSAHACKNKSNYRASVRTSSCTQTPTHAPCPWSIQYHFFPCMAKHCESRESQKRPVQLHIFTSYCIPVFCLHD